MGYESLKQKFDGLQVFRGKIIFPSTPVPSINNDQFLNVAVFLIFLRPIQII